MYESYPTLAVDTNVQVLAIASCSVQNFGSEAFNNVSFHSQAVKGAGVGRVSVGYPGKILPKIHIVVIGRTLLCPKIVLGIRTLLKRIRIKVYILISFVFFFAYFVYISFSFFLNKYKCRRRIFKI